MGNVSASSDSSSYAGGIAGYNREGGTISNCYYLNIIAKGVGGGTDNTVSCTLKQMTQQDTFVGFDFDTVWTMEGNEDYLYPELQNVPMQFEKELASISVTPPTKTEYLEGKETLDITGGKLTLTYNNGTSEVIDLTTDMVNGFDNTKIGKQTLTVTYQEKTTTFEVEIIAKSLDGIAVTAPPTKTKYLEGKEQLDVTGGKLTLTYNNGTSEVIDLTTDMVSGFDNTKVGKQTLTVTYQGKATTLEVEIIAKSLDSIKVTTLPSKRNYLEGKDKLDVTGGKLTLTYNNGTTEVIDLAADMVSGFDNTKVGKQTLTVTYQGKTTTFEVEIIAVTVPFRDVDKDAYYAAAVDWAVSNEITNGTSDSTFSPDEGCTRAQVVTFLWRAAGKPAPASSTNPFSDVKPGAYYYNAVLWAVEKGITNGTSDSTFSPDEGCTRAQVVTFLWRAAGKPDPASSESSFSDVKEGAYYYNAVLWAVENGITNGTSDTTFSPDETCTRAQIVTFLWRAAGKPDPASSENPFSDVKEGAYYYNAVLWAVEKGITNGTSDKSFSPDETCTRAQIVTFLWRYEEQPAPAGTNNPFADVKPNAYFGSAVLWAVEKGITNGTSATTFDPEDTCTRAQVVTFLYRDIVKS